MAGDLHQNFENPARPGAESEVDRIGARRHPLVAEVRRRLERVLPDLEGPVVVAVSGGADSTALLLAIASIASTYSIDRAPIDPVIAHVHHHLRAEADLDAAFVCGLGAALDLPVHLLDVFPDKRPGNLAANAREDRYEALGRLAGTLRASAVLVAHHAEDQLETILMHLGRGCALAGLTGMPWVGSIPGLGELPIPLVRPLLASSRAECESLCNAAGIRWRDDASNEDRTKARTRVREDILPVLQSLWPGVAQRVQHLSSQATVALQLLEQELARTFGPSTKSAWERSKLAALDESLVAAGLHRALSAQLPSGLDTIDGAMLEHAAIMIRDDERRPRTLDWPRGMTLHINARTVALVIAEETKPHVTGDDDSNDLGTGDRPDA